MGLGLRPPVPKLMNEAAGRGVPGFATPAGWWPLTSSCQRHRRRRSDMGRIVVSENVSLDGIMQDPTGDEGFKFGGWFDQMPDDVRAEWAKVEYQEALDTAAWLVGRGTYTWFAGRWADRPGEWADRLRSVPKYVVSSTLEDPAEWANSVVLQGDVVEQVTKLKQTVDGDILVYGSGPLV